MGATQSVRTRSVTLVTGNGVGPFLRLADHPRPECQDWSLTPLGDLYVLILVGGPYLFGLSDRDSSSGP